MIQQLLQIRQTVPLTSYASTKEWAATYYQLVKDLPPFEKALIGGFVCQQFSFAFLAGYQAALEKMFPTIAPNELKALCVSEAKGGHPKAIETVLEDYQIKGEKTYITAGSEVAHLLILGKTNQIINGKPLLKLIHLPKEVANLEITDFELPMMKEVKHGKAILNNVPISPTQILEGDGYTQYTKPFRTLEDILVGTAYVAMLLRQAMDYQWEEAIRDQLILHLYTLKNLLTLPPSDKETHLLLSTHEQNFEKLLPTIEASITNHSPNSFQADWSLNKRITTMGKKLKEVRLTKARRIFL